MALLIVVCQVSDNQGRRASKAACELLLLISEHIRNKRAALTEMRQCTAFEINAYLDMSFLAPGHHRNLALYHRVSAACIRVDKLHVNDMCCISAPPACPGS